MCVAFLHPCIAQHIISGKVINEEGVPLHNVSITDGDKNRVAKTDTAGNYSFTNVTSIKKLFFSYVGFEPVVKNITDGNTIPVTLVRNNVFLEEAVVKAFEFNRKLKDIPAAVSVLNRSSLERYGNLNFVPALNTVPGVKMDERSPGSYRLSIRGNLLRSTFGVRNVKMYWNGIPFTDANGNTYLNQISFNNIGKIEVIKGPSGSMYGSGTGGVVLLTSPLSIEKSKYFLLQSVAGSYGLVMVNGAYNVSDGNKNSSLSFAHQESGGYREQSDMRKDVANFAGTFSIGTRQNISANIFYSDLYYQTPGGLTPAELAVDPRQARPAAGIFNSAVEQKAALYLKTFYTGLANEIQLDNSLINTTSLYVSHTSLKNPTIRNYEHKTEQGIGMRSVLRYNHDVFKGTLGGEYQYSFNNTATFGNRFGVSDTLQYHDEINSRQFNLFLQTGVNIRNILVSAGLSYNNYYYGFVRLSDAGSGKESSNFSPRFIPRVSISGELNDRVNMYAVVSKGYSPPSIDEVHASDGRFNRALRAESGINYEAGIKSNPIKNKLWADISYYIFSLQNTIVSRRDNSGADFYVNAGKTKQRGLEAAINYIPVNNDVHFIRMVKAWASYTNIHARFADYQQGNIKFDGNKLTGTPPNVVVTGVDINMEGFFGNFSFTYTDKIPLNDANTFFAPGYSLLYVKAGFKTNPDWKIPVEVFAAFEKSLNGAFSLGNDLNAASNRFYNPSSIQNFTIGAKFRFNIR